MTGTADDPGSEAKAAATNGAVTAHAHGGYFTV
jgi:hypothetical protein